MEEIRKVSCSGGKDSQSRHPLIYLKIDDKAEITCPYCSKKFSVGKRKNNKAYIEASEAVTLISNMSRI